MSSDKDKLNRIVEQLDEILLVLNKMSEDLRGVSASTKSIAVKQITSQQAVERPAKLPQVSHKIHEKSAEEKMQSMEDVRMVFPEELDSLLSFEDGGDFIVIKPKQFLGSENFAKIASTVRGIGGEYISAGKDSHFRVYKKRS